MENTLPNPLTENIQVTATLPSEMVEAQSKLIVWAENKLAAEQQDAKELKEAYEHAKSRKWKHTTLEAAWKKAEKRVIFYSKLKSAIEQGYSIVPNFPVQIFAIRTEKATPRDQIYYGAWLPNNPFEQKPMELPETVGDYQNPRPTIRSTSSPTTEQPNRNAYWTGSWDELDFPVNMAKPHIMEAVDRAMALKIFDQFGVLPGTRKNDDPIIIGQIRRKSGYTTNIISFMIAWHLDTRVL